MDTVVSVADRWGEIGIILAGLYAGLAVIGVMLVRHQKDCNAKDAANASRFATGEERMDGIDVALKRGTEKMDSIKAGQETDGRQLAAIEERTRAQGETLVRIEQNQNQLIGFHERRWTDRGDEAR